MNDATKKQIRLALMHLESARDALKSAHEQTEAAKDWRNFGDITRYLSEVSDLISSEGGQCGFMPFAEGLR